MRIDLQCSCMERTEIARSSLSHIHVLRDIRTSMSKRASSYDTNLIYLTRLSANAVTISSAIDGSQVTIAGFRLNTWPEFAIISLARK